MKLNDSSLLPNSKHHALGKCFVLHGVQESYSQVFKSVIIKFKVLPCDQHNLVVPHHSLVLQYTYGLVP